MRTWDLHSSAAKLRQAMKDLKTANERIADEWQDEKAREMEHAFIDPLEPMVRSTLLAIAELADVLDKAERACGSE